jgi:RHS repeat-associated protein
MQRSIIGLFSFVAAGLILLLLGGACCDLSAQSFCGIPSPPPAPPPPPPPPPYCTPKDCNKCTKSPCYVATGGYTNDFNDLQIWTRGFPISVSRHYESSRFVDGPIGVGWMFSLTPRIYYAVYLYSAPSTYSHEAEVLTADGSLLRFSEAGGVFSPTYGRTDSLVHNADGTFDLKPQNTRSTLHFNVDGTIAKMTDTFGNSVSFTYDGNGRLASVQDDAGSARSISVTWGSNGRIATLTDSTGRIVSYTYDPSGSLTNVTNPKGQVTTMTYAPGRFAPHMTSIHDPWNRVISDMVWQSDDRLLSYTEGLYTGANSAGEKYTYGYASGSTTKTDSFSTHFYNTDPNTFLASDSGTAYDSAGRPTMVTEGVNQVLYWYDTQGRVETLSKGNVYWKYTYDPNFPEQATSLVGYNDFNGQNPNLDFAGTYVVYVPPGQPGAGAPQDIQQMRSDGTWKDTLIHYGYGSKGEITTSTDPRLLTSTFAYNAAGDLITSTSPAGTTQYDYDVLGRLTTKTNALGKATTYTYDELDRITSITLPKPSAASSLTFVTTFSYDNYDAASGLTFTQTTDPNGHVTKVGQDALGHVVQEVDAANNVTTYNYKYNLLDTIVDANGNTTRFTYDGTRTRNGTVRPDGGVETFTSTADGTMYSKLDARGISASYAYDAWGRVTSASWSKNGQFLESFTTAYVGQKLMSVTYSRGGVDDVISYAYDTSFRVLTETQGTRAKITYTYPAGVATTDLPVGYSVGPVSGSGPTTSTSYGYDAARRITSINWSRASGAVTFAYNAMGQFTNITLPNGQQRAYTYDDQGRLTQLANTSPTGVFAFFDYAYDHDWSTNLDAMKGQLTSVSVNASASLLQRLGLTKYTYDVRHQLTRIDYPNGVELVTYDAIGNRQTYGGASYSYYPNASGGSSTRLKNDGYYPGDFAYDAKGNLLGLTSSPTAQWDAHNRLLSTTSNYTQAYDYSGRRISGKTSSNTTSYVYDGLHVVSERTSSPVSQNDYLFGPGIDQPLALTNAQSVTSYYMTDGLGSIIGAVKPDGTIDNPVNYTSFGVPGNGSPGLFGYTGREYSGTGYTYFRARHYDSQRGRFISEDPLNDMVPVIGGDLYGYAANSPVMNVDPMGLDPCKWTSTYGLWVRTGSEWSQEWRAFRAVITQVPMVPKISGTRWPIWVKMIMTCDFNEYMRITTHWSRKMRIHLECDCPSTATTWDDQQTKTDSYEFFLKGAETTSSWMMGAPMKPCPQPK